MDTTLLTPYAMFTPGPLEIAVMLVVLFFLATLFLVAVLLLSMAFSARKRHSTPGRKASMDSEVEMVQELNRGLARLEDRIESLETLLLGQAQRGDEV